MKDKYVLKWQRSIKGQAYKGGTVFPNEDYPAIDHEFKKIIAEGSAIHVNDIKPRNYKPKLSPLQRNLLEEINKKNSEKIKKEEPVNTPTEDENCWKAEEPKLEEKEEVVEESPELSSEIDPPLVVDEMTIQELRSKAKELGINSYQKGAEELKEMIKEAL